ncbi:MAG: tyrosine-protein phosphatase, partial [Pseudomonadota bacterium]
RFMISCAALALGLAGCSEQAPETGATVGAVTAEHGETANDYTISWDGGTPVTIEVSTSPDFAEGTVEAIGSFDGGLASWSADGEAKRRYFRLTPDGGASEEVAVRLLPLEGGRNFRDLGGYETEDGQIIKWGKVFRSGVMSGLTDGDYTYLGDLGITTVCDFREADERASEPTDWRAGEIEYMTFAPPPEGREGANNPMFAVFRNPEATPDDVRAAMAAGYPAIAMREDEGYTAMFDQLAAGQIPLAFNCSAGKDRAGTAAAMLLVALGVPRETVVEDYALSDDYVDYMAEFLSDEARAKAAKEGEESPYAFLMNFPPEMVAPLMESNPIYIETTLDAMEKEHGSVLAYIQKEFDVTDEELSAIRSALLK